MIRAGAEICKDKITDRKVPSAQVECLSGEILLSFPEESQQVSYNDADFEFLNISVAELSSLYPYALESLLIDGDDSQTESEYLF